MKSEFTCTMSLADEDRQLLQNVYDALKAFNPALIGTPYTHIEHVDTLAGKAAKAAKAETAEQAQEPVEAAKTAEIEKNPEPVKEYTLEEVRARVMATIHANADMQAKVKKALNKYADSVPHMDPKDYPAFMADLEGLS